MKVFISDQGARGEPIMNAIIPVGSSNEETTNIIVKDEVFKVVVSGQGPRGEQGPPGFSDAGYLLPVQIPIAKHKALSVKHGTVRYANNDDYETRTIGFSMNEAGPGYEVLILSNGQIEFPSAVFIAGMPVFLGMNGELTQTPPVSGIVQKVGTAYSEYVLLINIQQPIILR